MKLNKIAFAALAVASTGAFAAAAVVPKCTTAAQADAALMVKACSPEITFYAAGATAMKGAIQAVLTTQGVVFDKAQPFATITTAASGDMYAYYGYGAASTAWANKRVAVIVNGKNGSMAGVNQLLTGLKSGSVELVNGLMADQQEYKTIALVNAKNEEAKGLTIDGTVTVSSGNTALAATITLSSERIADFKTAWGKDAQKVAHMAFSDVRPSEATPGQIAKWDPKAFPAETIAMQGFGVVVNNAMYKALQTREIAAGRLVSTCQDDMTAACQPSVYSADMTALITGKTQSAAAFLGNDAVTTVLNLNRRPASSGTQASTQIRFAGEANYMGKTPLATGFDMIGDEAAGGAVVSLNSGLMTVKTHSGTSGLLAQVGTDTGLSIGVASLDNKAASKFGTPASGAATAVSGTSAQTMRWVKLDGISPDAAGGVTDSTQRNGLKAGYDFAMEFQTLKSAALAAPYAGIYTAIVNGLKDPAANLTGVAYIGSTDASKNTAFTRGGNNFFPLNKY